MAPPLLMRLAAALLCTFARVPPCCLPAAVPLRVLKQGEAAAAAIEVEQHGSWGFVDVEHAAADEILCSAGYQAALARKDYYYVLLAPISRGTLPCAMHGHAPWLLAGSLHSSPAGAFAGTPRNVLCPLQSVAPCTPLRCLVVVWAFRPRQARPVRSDAWVS